MDETRRSSRPVCSWWDAVESLISAFMGTILAVGIISIFAFTVIDRYGELSVGERMACGIVALILVCFEPFVLFTIWSTMWRIDLPLAFGVARRQPLWPVYVRPFVSGLWALHFYAGFVGIVVFHDSVGGRHPMPREPVETLWVAVPITFASAFAANAFLLQSVAAFVRDEGILRRVWRYRVAFDVLVAVAAWICSRADMMRYLP